MNTVAVCDWQPGQVSFVPNQQSQWWHTTAKYEPTRANTTKSQQQTDQTAGCSHTKNKYLSDNPDYYKILNNTLKKSEYQEKDDKWNEYVYKLKIIANAATVVESKYTELISMKNKILVKRYDEVVNIADTKEKETTLKKLKLQKDEIKKLNANAEILTDLLKQIEKHTNNKKVDLIFVSSSINNIIYLINQYSLYGNSDDELQKINNTLNNMIVNLLVNWLKN